MTPAEKLNKAYQNIQNLQIQPSRTNTMILAETFLLLEEVNKALSEPKTEEQTEEAAE